MKIDGKNLKLETRRSSVTGEVLDQPIPLVIVVETGEAFYLSKDDACTVLARLHASGLGKQIRAAILGELEDQAITRIKRISKGILVGVKGILRLADMGYVFDPDIALRFDQETVFPYFSIATRNGCTVAHCGRTGASLVRASNGSCRKEVGSEWTEDVECMEDHAEWLLGMEQE